MDALEKYFNLEEEEKNERYCEIIHVASSSNKIGERWFNLGLRSENESLPRAVAYLTPKMAKELYDDLAIWLDFVNKDKH